MAKRKSTTILIFCLLLFTGCAKTEYVYVDKPVEVIVPVTQIPAIEPIKRPNLSIYKIDNNASYKNVAEAYYNSLKELYEYTKKLEKLMTPFYEEYKKQNYEYLKENLKR